MVASADLPELEQLELVVSKRGSTTDFKLQRAAHILLGPELGPIKTAKDYYAAWLETAEADIMLLGAQCYHNGDSYNLSGLKQLIDDNIRAVRVAGNRLRVAQQTSPGSAAAAAPPPQATGEAAEGAHRPLVMEVDG